MLPFEYLNTQTGILQKSAYPGHKTEIGHVSDRCA